MGPVCNIRDELRTEWQGNAVAIDIASGIFVDNKKVVPSPAPGDVSVFPYFHVAFGAQDEKTTIAPRAETVRSEPVQAHVAEAMVPAEHHVPKILKLRMVRVTHVAHLRCGHLSFG